jgi:ribose transport system substrate-binding protein
MRTATVSAVLALLVVSLAACKSADEPRSEPLIVPSGSQPPAQEEVPTRTVALVMKTLTNPFFVTVEKGARRAEKELGIRLLVRTHGDETAIQQQIAIVKQLIQDKVDAIVIIPGHSTEMIPVAKEAHDAGIVLINIDNRFDPEVSREWGLGDVPFVTVDNARGAYLSAQYLAGKLTRPTPVAIIEGDPAAQASKDRKRGALQAFSENPNTQQVVVETAHWKIDEAHDIAPQLFERHPDLGAIFCANDLMALGVIRYLDESKRSGVLVSAYDDIEEARTAMRQGKLLATVNQRAEEQGYMGVKYAVRALAGEKLPPETFVDVELITAESLSQEQR